MDPSLTFYYEKFQTHRNSKEFDLDGWKLTQEVKHLPSKCKALCSNPSTVKKKGILLGIFFYTQLLDVIIDILWHFHLCMSICPSIHLPAIYLSMLLFEFISK
jgi:hypothetical protein